MFSTVISPPYIYFIIHMYVYIADAELMNVQFRWGFWSLGIILRVLIIEVSVHNVTLQASFKPLCF